MSDLYQRFGLTTTFNGEERKFRNKLENVFINGQLGSDIFGIENKNLVWDFDNYIGEVHTSYTAQSTKFNHMLGNGLLLNEYLYRLQVIINIIWNWDTKLTIQLASTTNRFFTDSVLELDYFIKIYKTKAPQILSAGNKRSKVRIINALDILESRPKKYRQVLEHFESGMKEFLIAKTKSQFKDVIEDMSTVCDTLIKIIFNDQNLGFKHLFKENRWQTIKLNDTQKKIYSDLNNTIDQIKHDVIKSYSKDDVENIVYLTTDIIKRLAK